MKATMFEDDYKGIERELATIQMVVAIIKDYADREMCEDCKKVLKSAQEYFEGSVEGMKKDLEFFIPVPRVEIKE
jgi:hypothetical protein